MGSRLELSGRNTRCSFQPPLEWVHKSPLPPLRLLSSLHTYLVGLWAIIKAFEYDLSPALHSAAAKVIELPSGTSSAQFLLVFLTSEVSAFHRMLVPCAWLGKRV